MEVEKNEKIKKLVEELEKTTVKLADTQTASTGSVNLKGASIGKNPDSQYNVFIEDNGIVFFRDVQGIIKIKVPIDGSTKLVTNVSGYEGIIDIEGGNDSIIVITQE